MHDPLIRDIAHGLTMSLVSQAADLVPPRSDDNADDPVAATQITLSFLRAHQAHLCWPTVAHLAVAAVRHGAADVTRAEVVRVLTQTPSADVRKQVLLIMPRVIATP